MSTRVVGCCLCNLNSTGQVVTYTQHDYHLFNTSIRTTHVITHENGSDEVTISCSGVVCLPSRRLAEGLKNTSRRLADNIYLPSRRLAEGCKQNVASHCLAVTDLVAEGANKKIGASRIVGQTM